MLQGANEVPTTVGRLVLTGKRVIAPDPDAALASVGAEGTIVCLNPERELMEWPSYPRWLRANQPERALWFSMPDWTAPSLDEALVLFDDLHRRLLAGGTVIVHCSHGQGRAGTVGVAMLMMLGAVRGEAERIVATHRPGAGPASDSQSSLLARLADHLDRFD